MHIFVSTKQINTMNTQITKSEAQIAVDMFFQTYSREELAELPYENVKDVWYEWFIASYGHNSELETEAYDLMIEQL
jgi:hypothetical protein